ncbi:MAG: site-specific DNA-methyltransferase [Vicinamibacterales bacterium]
MSQLTNLLRELRTREPALAGDLEREVAALADRRAFGLNFERHVPEAVELPGRKIRKGDKVRILPARGDAPKRADERLWRVVRIDRSTGAASLELLAKSVPEAAEPVAGAREALFETRTAALDDLVVVAEFRDHIYPGLVSTGKVERGGDKPFHAVINAENFHALQLLLFTHQGNVDAIYIDPPYNTGARDWKYNNDYVEGDDLYRHSKWLAFIERRLLLAKELLNPANSVLVVTIDEKEYLRLGLLLEQTFPDAKIQMIASVINPKGTGRVEGFRRVDEYIYVARFGDQAVTSRADVVIGSLAVDGKKKETQSTADDEPAPRIPVEFQTARRRDLASVRRTRPGQFYPIYVNEKTSLIEAIGEPIPHEQDRSTAPQREGCVAVFPVREDGTEMNWAVTAPTFEERWKRGFARAGKAEPSKPQQFIIQYVKSGPIRDIEEGRAVVEGRHPDGSVIAFYTEEAGKTPPTHWNLRAHNAEHYGTKLVRGLLGGRSFPFPKSLYAVEDVLRFFVLGKPEALVVDFFSGSGTTAHAVMRLNKQDGGRRRAISITNNEVAAVEQEALRKKGLRPGDLEWERWGICEYITKPRIAAAITGKTPDGEPIKGDYKFTDEFPMADGFEENVEFFTLTYEAPLRVASHREFEKIAPLLWLRAGARGRRIEDVSAGWDVANAYGVLVDLDHTQEFLKAVAANDTITVAFIVTDEDRLFESVAQELPVHVEPVRLYEAYLRNFEIESGRGTL